MTTCAVSPLVLWRGESRTILVTVTDPETGDRANLASGTFQADELEFEIKTAAGAPDPALISKSLANGGVSLLPQSGDTLGQAHVGIGPTDFAAIAAGIYSYDVVLVLATGARIYVVKPSELRLRNVVNNP